MALTDLYSASGYSRILDTFAPTTQKGGVYVATLSGNVTLDETYPNICKLDPGGAARDVILDGAAATDSAIDGLYRRIVNGADAAENLVVKNAAGSTIATINQNEQGEFYHDADAGWTLICITTIALS